MASPDNPNNWIFDYGLLEDIHGELPSLDPPQVLWHSSSSASPDPPLPLSVDFDDSFANLDALKEIGSRKRFLELGSILDPGRLPKMDKAVLLSDAVRMVIQLRDEARKLKDTNDSLLEKINELKAEKNELRDEKQRLKTEKENLDRQVKALSSQPGFLPHPPAIPAPFSAPGQVVGGKLVPFVGYPGVSMWQFMPPAAVDTSQDHVLRPPVA
ncbi:transcription factor ILR3-like isoform X2 [Pistacia vera]|uniref:transcription factor ILR3-like isoform X2 n=1 Tax=Pistacia vera TaxID=55513 RepID=UPI0012639E0F|nr:transcription factor ILR3-like isoform X2 [Pistacia vera]XP_031287745.1 transcription factor ILR3-like isoform X2 [Pistacia vera]